VEWEEEGKLRTPVRFNVRGEPQEHRRRSSAELWKITSVKSKNDDAGI